MTALSSEQLKTVYVPPVIAFLVVVGLWQVVPVLLEIPDYILPTPVDIVTAAVENWERFRVSVTRTAVSSLIGFGFSVLGGVLAAIIMAVSKTLERSLYPYAIILQTIPVVAVAPIIVIWFGAGFNAIVIISFLIGFFPMISNTLIGMNSTDQPMRDLFRLYKASRWQMIWKLQLPAALPYMVGGMKISCTLVVIGAVVGEFIAGIGGGAGGLGYAITVAANRLQTPYLFACALAAAVLGIVFFLVVSVFSHWVLSSWHESEMEI